MRQGHFVDLEPFLRTHFKKFGYTTENYEEASNLFLHHIINENMREQITSVLNKIKKEIDEAREAQMGSMYA